MACAKPILAAVDGKGARVVEEAGAGFTCASGDAKGLASTVLKMHETDVHKRVRMGLRGKKYAVKHFKRHSSRIQGISHRITINNTA